MRDSIVINPDHFYDDPQLVLLLDVGEAALTKARRSGLLRFSRIGNRAIHSGGAVIAWLKAVETAAEEKAVAHVA